MQDWANIHCKYISYYLLRAKSENEICLPIQIESNLNICVTEKSKRRYQIIKYCNKAEDTFIETSIKSENKDIQQHTDMSVHIYVISISLNLNSLGI